MKKGIDEIRKSIKKRKRVKLTEAKTDQVAIYPLLPEEGEKYADQAPVIPQVNMLKKQKTFLFRVFASVLLFLGAATLLQTNTPALKTAKKWTATVLQEEFPFAKVNEWYVASFGAPISLTSLSGQKTADKGSFPVDGEVVETFATNGSGIMLSLAGKENIGAYDRGVVVFAGNHPETKKTVVIQHADGTKTTYGYLQSIDVHIYATVEANSKIGSYEASDEVNGFYFQMEKNNEYIDPTKVIPVDGG